MTSGTSKFNHPVLRSFKGCDSMSIALRTSLRPSRTIFTSLHTQIRGMVSEFRPSTWNRFHLLYKELTLSSCCRRPRTYPGGQQRLCPTNETPRTRTPQAIRSRPVSWNPLARLCGLSRPWDHHLRLQAWWYLRTSQHRKYYYYEGC